MLALADVIGLFSLILASFSRNVVPSAPIFSANVVPKSRCNRAMRFMFSGRYKYRWKLNEPLPARHAALAL